MNVWVSISEFTLNNIKEIQKWFSKFFGFEPSYVQVIQFVLHSTDLKNAELLARLLNYYIPIIGEDVKVRVRVMLSENVYEKWLSILNEIGQKGFQFKDLVAALIGIRLFYLPNSKGIEWRNYGDKN